MMDEIEKLQYENLRKQFNKIIHELLGKCYYNMAMDVYKCDEQCADDVIEYNNNLIKRLENYEKLTIIQFIIIVFLVIVAIWF